MRTLFSVLLFAGCLFGQANGLTLLGAGRSGAAGPVVFPALTLGVHAHTDNDTTSASSVVVSLGTPAVGSTIACAVKYADTATFSSLTDNVNSGVYFPAASLIRENNHLYVGGIYYHENVAATPTTVTLTYSAAATHGQMACFEIKNTPAAYALDSSFLASRAVNSVNPTTGTTLTPFGNGRFVLDALLFDAATTTAGSGFTLIENAGSVSSASLVALYPEYSIQTSATASNGPYTNGTFSNYADMMTAFAPNHSGSCGAAFIIDWSGGTNGNATATADLQNSVHGNHPQPNPDRCPGCTGGIAPGSWSGAGNPGIQYASAAYQPLQTARNCPYYTAPGVTSVGLQADSAAVGPTLAFDTPATTTTAFGCVMTDTPIATAGNFGLMQIFVHDGSDMVTAQMNSDGVTGTFLTKIHGATYSTPTIHWSPNTWYGIRLTERIGGTDSVDYYSYSGSGCSGTPTLLGTQSALGGSGNKPDRITAIGAGSSTYATGTHFFGSAILVDDLYGSTLVY